MGTEKKPENTVTKGALAKSPDRMHGFLPGGGEMCISFYLVTVTVTVYFFLPDLTVIFAFPVFLPLITPLLLTVAIFLLEVYL